MNIDTKYNIGDIVLYLDSDLDLVETKVDFIEILLYNNNTISTEYIITNIKSNDQYKVSENDIFYNKDLIKIDCDLISKEIFSNKENIDSLIKNLKKNNICKIYLSEDIFACFVIELIELLYRNNYLKEVELFCKNENINQIIQRMV